MSGDNSFTAVVDPKMREMALQAYSLLEMDAIDKLHTFRRNKHGNLFYEHNRNQETPAHLIQLPYLYSQLTAINPRRILEVGTNCGFFCYFAKRVVPEVKIITFDLGFDAYAAQAVDFLHEHFQSEYITYIEGDSRETISVFNNSIKDKEFPIDFAWVDGSHEYLAVFSDLTNCGELNIPHIYVDDFHATQDVQIAVKFFINSFSYDLIGITRDIRGIAYLKKEGSDG